jgi:hypothetical protein
VANFCRVAKEEKSILVGDVNYEKRLDSYRKLEAVSPDDIRPDITAIRGLGSLLKQEIRLTKKSILFLGWG